MQRPAPLLIPILAFIQIATAQEDISADLTKFLQDGKIPALAAAAVMDGKIIASGASGVRKYGDTTPVIVTDKFHIGSCTKSMTGTLAAMLVTDGKIKWSTSVAEQFPDLDIHPDFRSATLLQMTSNTGGVPKEIPPALWKTTVANQDLPEATQRMKFVAALLKSPPAYPPGTRNEYSNGGFTIAGAMLEKASGMDYQKLIRTRLFLPLHMNSAGFGMPATRRKVDQPYGHILRDGVPFPIPPGPNSDNPPAITPAGRVHLSILDLAKYASFHLGTAGDPLLDSKSLTFLHTIVPPAKDYAIGWTVLKRPWANGTALYHNGTNTTNYTVMWLAPDRKFAAVATCNIDSGIGNKACDDAVSFLIERYLK